MADALNLDASQLTLVGYFPKTTAIPEGYELPAHVKEICTVSGCINAPEGWIDHWLHNELAFYDSPAKAKRVVATTTSKLPWSLFAYRMLPTRFDKDGAKPISLPTLDVEPLHGSFVPIGFDAVSKSVSFCFECSPLSCNYLAQKVPVNEFCLVATFEEAVALAKRCASEEPEPGPYYLFEVLRAIG
ncbi:MAG TPA: hypothetical protein VH639_28800 [Bryobacteraceae bacterium]|jgi:hypothetical protein